jgi:DNA repair exonuclease SbcCD nuclease subunit
MVENNLKLPNNPNKKTLCLATHEDIDGLSYGESGYSSTTPLKQILFSDWDYVFNGHIHKHQIINNIITIGSPLQQTFSEEGNQKYFIHYSKRSYKKIPLNAVKFNTLKSLKEIDKIDDKNYYRIEVSSDEISNPIFRKYNVSYVITKTKEREIRLKINATEEDEIETYISLNNNNLDKTKLLKIGKELRNE